MRLIAVTGGIGSGKSVICNILSTLGYDVYDCDRRAKMLMDNSRAIMSAIKSDICADAIRDDDGSMSIDRKALAEVVFNDREKLNLLNNLVHSEVRNDIAAWCDRLERHSGCLIAFVETAILLESGLLEMVDEVWTVSAPDYLRIERAIRRDKSSKEQIVSRINNQRLVSQSDACLCGMVLHEIINDDTHAVLPQVFSLLPA